VTASGPLVVAHRGGASLAGGDIIEGIRRLPSLGFGAVEFDVRRTRDETIVVYHDEHWQGDRLDRFTFDVLVRRGCPLHRLDEVVAAAAGLALDVELKEAGYEPDVLRLLLTQVRHEQLIVTSFHDGALDAVKRHAPTVRTGLLVGRRPSLRAPLAAVSDAFPFRRMEGCRADFLAPSVTLLRAGVGRRARRRGLPLLVWTVRDPDALSRHLREPGMLGVVVDPEATGGVTMSDGPVVWPLPAGSP
jgi:glycerophosphoryl diester phosphodiesterase